MVGIRTGESYVGRIGFVVDFHFIPELQIRGLEDSEFARKLVNLCVLGRVDADQECGF